MSVKLMQPRWIIWSQCPLTIIIVLCIIFYVQTLVHWTTNDIYIYWSAAVECYGMKVNWKCWRQRYVESKLNTYKIFTYKSQNNCMHKHTHTKTGRQSFNQLLQARYLLHDNLLCSQLSHVYLLIIYIRLTYIVKFPVLPLFFESFYIYSALLFIYIV